MVLFKKEVAEEKKVHFKIELTPEIPSLPEIQDERNFDVKYPLISPYAYAHIFYDAKENELKYILEEPLLSEEEEKTLKILEEGLSELVNISTINLKTTETIIEYLEKNVNLLLNEFGIKISDEAFLKIMYYLYRDFIGLNEIEPLLKDYFIEDIECNGIKTPIYIVHRKYRNLKTNIIYNELNELTNFVEKLAQKSGKYISYANPLLDAQLPGGERVNATYTQEISAHGPSFTIRKFTKEPWTPIKLIDLKTVSPELLAFLWILIENESNIMIIGGTGAGKTSFLNAIAFFIPPSSRIVSIEDSVTGDSKIIIKQKEGVKIITIREFVKSKIDAEVMTLNKKGKIIFVKPSKYIQHSVKKDIYNILTSSGRQIKVTKDHSLFSLGDQGLIEIKPKELQEGKSFIAVPRNLPIEGKKIEKINLMLHIKHFKDDFLQGKPIQKIFKKYNYHQLRVNKSRYQWWKKHNIIKIKEFLKLNINFNYDELSDLKIKSKNTSSIPIIFKISKEFLEFCGLWLGDGSYDNHNRNSVILSNMDKECRNIFKKIAFYIKANYSSMNDEGVSLRIHSTIFYKFMKYVLKFDGYSNSKKIPNFIFKLSNKQIGHFVRGYFSADGCIKKYEVSCASQSYALLEVLQTIFLRLGIISRINDFNRKDKCINLSISSFENIKKFKEIGFLQERKKEKLASLNFKAHHANSDIIPLTTKKLNELNKISLIKLQYPYLKEWQHIGRDYMQKLAPHGSEFNDLSHSDILWDKVKKIKKLNSKKTEVFDLSIPGHEKFLCNNIFVHNTREINLLHQNWLPSVARESTSIEQKGEIDLFTLLRESFRQRPDYVIVGEVRGKEAFVLFQGMSSGHPSFGTMHAEDVETMIRRLESPPIDLSPSLVASLDVVCVITQTKVLDQEVRRLKEIVEIVEVEKDKLTLNKPFVWDPKSDAFYFKTDSKIFDKIAMHRGINKERLQREFKLRSQLLLKMYRNKIFSFKEVNDIIAEYYKNPLEVLKRFNIQ